jgi:hypothetical protein
MTFASPVSEPRASRWLPATVISLFALVLVADVAVALLFGGYRNLVEGDRVAVTFAAAAADAAIPLPVDPVPGGRLVGADGEVLVESRGDRLVVRAPGELVIRFRSPDAGAGVELDYRFSERRMGAGCEIALGRVASRYGVDTINRRRLDGARRPSGRYHHDLADHAGWFELRVTVNREAAAAGFEVTLPEVVWR